jgi:hypothetical protein
MQNLIPDELMPLSFTLMFDWHLRFWWSLDVRLEVKYGIADPRREPTNNINHHQATE